MIGLLRITDEESIMSFKPNQTKEKPDTHRKTFSGLNYILAAGKKVAGVFRIFLPRQRKSYSKYGAIDDSTSISQVSKLSYSTDYSTESNTKSLRKCSRSYGYSSSSKSGQATTIYFSFGEIYKATENFSPANKIGGGGSGTVCKGKLKDGSIVAVKRARKYKHDKYLLLEFKNEILTLSKIEHLNLVKLFGFLEHGDERYCC